MALFLGNPWRAARSGGSETQKSLFFFLLPGNSPPETGSLKTGPSASRGSSPRRRRDRCPRGDVVVLNCERMVLKGSSCPADHGFQAASRARRASAARGGGRRP